MIDPEKITHCPFCQAILIKSHTNSREVRCLENNDHFYWLEQKHSFWCYFDQYACEYFLDERLMNVWSTAPKNYRIIHALPMNLESLEEFVNFCEPEKMAFL